MARKRSPEHDWICRRCGCACTMPGAPEPRHVGGGQGLRACRWAPDPVLRADHEAEAAAVVAALLDRRRR